MARHSHCLLAALRHRTGCDLAPTLRLLSLLPIGLACGTLLLAAVCLTLVFALVVPRRPGRKEPWSPRFRPRPAAGGPVAPMSDAPFAAVPASSLDASTVDSSGSVPPASAATVADEPCEAYAAWSDAVSADPVQAEPPCAEFAWSKAQCRGRQMAQEFSRETVSACEVSRPEAVRDDRPGCVEWSMPGVLTPPDVTGFTVARLRKLASQQGHRGTRTMRRADLLALLEAS